MRRINVCAQHRHYNRTLFFINFKSFIISDFMQSFEFLFYSFIFIASGDMREGQMYLIC